MKCGHHSSDMSSAVGVCASCLRQRLFLLISVQSRSQLHSEFNSDPPPTLTFPHSIYPYADRCDFSDHRFRSTPQIGPSINESQEKKRRKSRFSFITSMFTSRSDKSESDPRTASTSSPLWSKSRSVPKYAGERIQNRVSDRGMSPLRSSFENDDSSSRSSESCEPKWKQTPVSVSAATPSRRRHSTMSGLAFCLSPLVRASPNRNWKHNSLPLEGGEIAASRKAARLAAANSFGKNKSKKMADFGRRGSY